MKGWVGLVNPLAVNFWLRADSRFIKPRTFETFKPRYRHHIRVAASDGRWNQRTSMLVSVARSIRSNESRLSVRSVAILNSWSCQRCNGSYQFLSGRVRIFCVRQRRWTSSSINSSSLHCTLETHLFLQIILIIDWYYFTHPTDVLNFVTAIMFLLLRFFITTTTTTIIRSTITIICSPTMLAKHSGAHRWAHETYVRPQNVISKITFLCIFKEEVVCRSSKMPIYKNVY